MREKAVCDIPATAIVKRIKNLEPTTPAHVRACSGNRERARWFFHSWNGVEHSCVLYYCNSWRCSHCAPKQSALLYARAIDAFETKNTGERMVFLVLTKQRPVYATAKDAVSLYKEMGPMMARARKRIEKLLSANGFPKMGSNWLATIEAHQSGWPHVNLVVQSEGLARLIDAEKCESRTSKGGSEIRILRGKLGEAFRAGGFDDCMGQVQLKKEKAVAYIAKVAKESSKLSQLPVFAGERFRRYRSGKGFLPATIKQKRQAEAKENKLRWIRGEEGAELRGGGLVINREKFKLESPQFRPWSQKIESLHLDSIYINEFHLSDSEKAELQRQIKNELSWYNYQNDSLGVSIRYDLGDLTQKERVDALKFTEVDILRPRPVKVKQPPIFAVA